MEDSRGTYKDGTEKEDDRAHPLGGGQLFLDVVAVKRPGHRVHEPSHGIPRFEGGIRNGPLETDKRLEGDEFLKGQLQLQPGRNYLGHDLLQQGLVDAERDGQ